MTSSSLRREPTALSTASPTYSQYAVPSTRALMRYTTVSGESDMSMIASVMSRTASSRILSLSSTPRVPYFISHHISPS